jgi:hypothetical protein
MLMQLFSWLRQRQTGQHPRRHTPARRPAPRFRPQLEALEGRDLPSTLTVLNNLDSGTGSLRAEIAAAHSGDTIVFDPSLNGQTIVLTSGELGINTNLTIQGPGSSQLSIYGGGPTGSRVFWVWGTGTTVTLSRLTICGGSGTLAPNVFGYSNDGLGGGIYNAAALTLSACTLTNNSVAPYYYPYGQGPRAVPLCGGGVYNAGTLTINNSTVTGNSASDEVAADLYGVDGLGGGIYNAGTLTVSNSTLTGNIAYGSGGGIFNASNATATVMSCTLSHNSADTTNALSYNTPPGVTEGAGGGIYTAGTLSLTSCTLSGNYATSEGGGIFSAKSSKLTLQSSVVHNNVAPLGADLFNLGGAKISKDSTVGVIA